MSTQSAYSSTHPDVIASMDAADEAAAEFSRQLTALKDEFGAPAFFADQWSIRRFVGFGEQPQVEGVTWKPTSSGRLWWPKANTKAGKALAKRFEAIHFGHDTVPGMSSYVMEGATHRTHGLFRHEGVVWVSWSCSHDIVEMYGKPAPDLDLWERRKLSEFFAAREAVDKVNA